jgi:hypothetical protein
MNTTHRLNLTKKVIKGTSHITIEAHIDVDSDIFTREPIPNCENTKITPLDGSEKLYYHDLYELSKEFEKIVITPLKK